MTKIVGSDAYLVSPASLSLRFLQGQTFLTWLESRLGRKYPRKDDRAVDLNDGSNERVTIGVSTWNYRVVKKNGCFAIHEAYYDDSGKVRSLSVDPVSPAYDDLATLVSNLELMLAATEQDILDFEQIDSSL